MSETQLPSLGTMGEHVGRIYGQVERRPKHVVEQPVGIDQPRRAGRRRADRGPVG